jgi:hypothetical protein
MAVTYITWAFGIGVSVEIIIIINLKNGTKFDKIICQIN